MIRKSITVTEQQDAWIRAQVDSGHYGNDSELIRELIRERQLRATETQEDVQRIRALLQEGERSGFTSQSAEEILKEIQKEMRRDGLL